MWMYAHYLFQVLNIIPYLARWYDPSIGRFITEDTYEGELTIPLSLNNYLKR
ncbi:hypothetical protein M3650_25360 [Paenibacillus sp. MER TA 81-3]|uniref:hypothetical protein n=1 Tax=Paenibacillus sp. MER TA 81-3 TaxID=2939573 RepID=UPI0020415AE0|nr:hypothetical protein [Paenibacillus sp. MER TA 81-3]MCM3341864.1 hypothetical protein [Paenibacillus sp. MER TA 81-3]